MTVGDVVNDMHKHAIIIFTHIYNINPYQKVKWCKNIIIIY